MPKAQFYRIMLKIGQGDAYVTRVSLPAPEKDKLLTGEPIVHEGVVKVFVKNKTKHYNDLMGQSGDALIASARLTEIIRSLTGEGEVQLLPVDMEGRPYNLIQILNVVDAIDRQRATFTMFDNTNILRSVTNLVLQEEKLQGINLFRLKGLPVPVFISTELHDRIVEAGITGVDFIHNMDLTKDYDPDQA